MIRYKKLGYAVLCVTDLDKSIDFYTNIVGMQFVERVGETAYLRTSHDHHNLILEQAPEAGLKRVGFELEKASQFQDVFNYLEEKGLNPRELSAKETQELAQGRTLRFKDPLLGVTYEMYVEMMQMGTAYKPTNGLEIECLLHVVYETNQFDEVYDFLVNTMNMAVSDIQGREMAWAWLRVWPNPYHHSFAITKGPENKLNHIAYKVKSIDDIGKQVNVLKNHDVKIHLGPGRHHPSGSVFLYFADPDGLTLEYSQGMEEFPEENPREPRRLEPSLLTLDEWGGQPGKDFGKYGKLIVEDGEVVPQ
ncbi:VOC family protein [Niallia endozanthoxylica]|uniref:2,3-dihydroxy-p-cumate-3,4-dioxygenase n=1 Tax=Niallia endozanthoxylica TaxID=2036016 RepID=A0A5J5I4A4_9BACI|nr:VOC family protein [Niallia endozanthoxylica]KAA9029988.1 2,3-dihydroxy-p-cumate-3,4-dioxygenase [Niallia endozanthoxylica]